MESLQIKDYMTARPVALSATMTVAEAVELLLEKKQTGGPVLGIDKKVVGFLSEQDCIRQMIESSYYRERVCKVSEIMKTEVLSVKPYDSIIELAQLMTKQKPKIYPVVDDDGYLVGAIDRSSVLKALDMQLHSGYEQHG
jgi:CBS domain-containing protein